MILPSIIFLYLTWIVPLLSIFFISYLDCSFAFYFLYLTWIVPRYSWNIVGSGVELYNPKTLPRVYSIYIIIVRRRNDIDNGNTDCYSGRCVRIKWSGFFIFKYSWWKWRMYFYKYLQNRRQRWIVPLLSIFFISYLDCSFAFYFLYLTWIVPLPSIIFLYLTWIVPLPSIIFLYLTWIVPLPSIIFLYLTWIVPLLQTRGLGCFCYLYTERLFFILLWQDFFNEFLRKTPFRKVHSVIM
jgi:hypothetical protein